MPHRKEEERGYPVVQPPVGFDSPVHITDIKPPLILKAFAFLQTSHPIPCCNILQIMHQILRADTYIFDIVLEREKGRRRYWRKENMKSEGDDRKCSQSSLPEHTSHSFHYCYYYYCYCYR